MLTRKYLSISFQHAEQQSGAGLGFDVHRTEDYHSQCSPLFGNHQEAHQFGDKSPKLQRSTVQNTRETRSHTQIQHQRHFC